MTDQLLHDPDTHRLGKADAKPPHADAEEFVDFEKAEAIVSVPANIINSASVRGGAPFSIPLAMYLNDREGDCTCAGAGNMKRVLSRGADAISDDTVQQGYVYTTKQEGAAFDPATGANDNGCVEIDVLDNWVKVPLFGGGLLGHAAVNYRLQKRRRLALYLFGALYPGWQLSTDQQRQAIWAPGPARPGSWGGHCAPIFDDFTDLSVFPGRVINGVPIPSDIEEILSLGTWGGYKLARGSYVPWACDELHIPFLQDRVDSIATDPVLSQIVDEPKLRAYLATFQPES